MLTQSNSGASSILRRVLGPVYRRLFFVWDWQYFPKKKMIQALRLSPKKDWMSQRMQSDLKRIVNTDIPQNFLNLVATNPQGSIASQFVLFEIRQNRLFCKMSSLFVVGSRFLTYQRVLRKLVQEHDFDDMQFIIYFADALNEYIRNDGSSLPIFCFAKQKSASTLLIPDHEAIIGYKGLLKEVQTANQKYPWKEKKAQLYWRGASTTGGFLTKEAYQKAPRVRLVRASLASPNMINARFSHLVEADFEVREIMRRAGFVDRAYPIAEHIKHKYQVLIDGNTSSYSRAFWQLNSNCLMFKVDSDDIQWFYEGLIPWEHFVPVRADLSDLLEKIEWAKSHENQVRQIIRQANEFARSHLSHSAILQYLYSTLKLYSSFSK